MINPFFKNSGPFKISDILHLINLVDLNIDNNQEINDIKDLLTSKKNDITFFHSKKYKNIAKDTKASFCLTTEILKDEFPKSCTPLNFDVTLEVETKTFSTINGVQLFGNSSFKISVVKQKEALVFFAKLLYFLE